MRSIRLLALSAALIGAAVESGIIVAAPPPQDARAWIAASNRHAQVLLDVLARVSPESAGQFGVAGLDEEVTDLSTDAGERGREATAAAARDAAGQPQGRGEPARPPGPRYPDPVGTDQPARGPVVAGSAPALHRCHGVGIRRPPIAARRAGGSRAPAGRGHPSAQIRRTRAGLRAHRHAGDAADARSTGTSAASSPGRVQGRARPGQRPNPPARPRETLRPVQGGRLARTIRDAEAAAHGVSAIRALGGSARGAHGFSSTDRPLRALARTGGRRTAAGAARHDGAAGVRRHPGRDAAPGACGGKSAWPPEHELSRRHPRAQEGTARRRGDSAALPPAARRDRGHHPARTARHASRARGADPHRHRRRGGPVAGPEHAAASTHRQHRRDG